MRFRFGSKLLYFKLVGMFVFFGLIVGYISFLTGTAISSYEIYQSFRNGFGGTLHNLMESEEPDLLYRAFVEEPEIGRQLETALSSLIPESQKSRIRLSLFVQTPPDDRWVMISRSNTSEPLPVANPAQEDHLNKALGSRHVYKPEVYLGAQDRRNFYFDLTGEDDRMSYILQLSLERDGLKELMTQEKSTFYSFTVIVLIFSLILGALFARSFSVPIRKLTDQALSLSRGHMDVRFKSRRLDDIGILARSLDSMSVSLKHRFDSMQTMNRIDRAVLSSVSRRELLKKVAGYISEQFDSAASAVLIHREEGLLLTALEPHTEGYEGKIIPYSRIPGISSLSEPDPREFDMDSCPGSGEIIPAPLQRKKTFYVPILLDEHRVATFLISMDRVSDQDREALRMLSDQTGVALRSMNEMEQREEMSLGILLALTRSVDAKSRWTAGHSERVADLSEKLARSCGLREEEIQTVRISALLHDIGKLGIPEAILDKPGKLSDEEFEIIKSHPEKGDTIIKDIPGFDDVRLGVRHHHERWNGTGYPDGLAGEEIPLTARILTLADVYDAVTEDRPYRKGFSADEILQFLKDQSGLLFDPSLLELFFDMIRDNPAS